MIPAAAGEVPGPGREGGPVRRGAILEAIRKENRNSVIAAAVLSAPSVAAVLLFNWKYMYNWAAGPFRFDAALAAAPGCPRVRAGRGPAPADRDGAGDDPPACSGARSRAKSISANYMAMLAGDRFLMVKVKPEFSGKDRGGAAGAPSRVDPRLAGVRGGGGRARRRRFYPYLLEQTELPLGREPLRDDRDAPLPAVAPAARLRVVAGGAGRAARRAPASEPARPLSGPSSAASRARWPRPARRRRPDLSGSRGTGSWASAPPCSCTRAEDLVGVRSQDLRPPRVRPEAHAALLAEGPGAGRHPRGLRRGGPRGARERSPSGCPGRSRTT